MPGVQVFSNSPVHSRSSSIAGPSPSYTPTHLSSAPVNGPSSFASNVPASVPATMTTTATATSPSSSTYKPASLGAALPASTSTMSASFNRQPTPTRTQAYIPSMTSSDPPPPRPGQLPAPYTSNTRSSLLSRNIPPPPKVGEKAQDPSFYLSKPPPGNSSPTHQTPYSPQTVIPLPDAFRFGTQQHASLTSQNEQMGPPSHLSNSGQGFGPSRKSTHVRSGSTQYPPGYSRQRHTSHVRSGSTQHPPGYMQDPYATEMTPDQRRASQFEEQSDSSTGFDPVAAIGSLYGNLRSRSIDAGKNAGILTGDGRADEGDVWTMASGWVKGTSKKLAEVEEEVWRKISGR